MRHDALLKNLFGTKLIASMNESHMRGVTR